MKSVGLLGVAFSLLVRIILIPGVSPAVAGDSLQVPDSLEWRSGIGSIPSDSSASWSDSNSTASNPLARWVYPVGLMAVAVAAIYALFAVRSK